MLRDAYDRITATRRSRHKRPTIHTRHTDPNCETRVLYYQAKFDELVARGREVLEARGVGADEVQEALNIDANRVFSVVSARSSTAH